MAKRWNVTNVPEELHRLVVEAGKGRRETVPQTILRMVGDRVLGCVNADTTPTRERHGSDTTPHKLRFVPLTLEEARAKIEEKK